MATPESRIGAAALYRLHRQLPRSVRGVAVVDAIVQRSQISRLAAIACSLSIQWADVFLSLCSASVVAVKQSQKEQEQEEEEEAEETTKGGAHQHGRVPAAPVAPPGFAKPGA